MKSPVLSFVTALSGLFLFAAVSVAQPYGAYHDPLAPRRPQPGTILGRTGYAVSNHSLSAQILGVEYSFEGALGGNFTLIGRAGLVPTGIMLASSISGTFDSHFSMAAGLTLEPRFYTSFDRRARLGRSTFMNSSDFVSFPLQGLWASEGFVFAFTPQYGIRRTTGDHWAHEFTFGPRFAFFDDVAISPHVGYRLVFMF